MPDKEDNGSCAELALLKFAIEDEGLRQLIQETPSLRIMHYVDLWSLMIELPAGRDVLEEAVMSSGDPVILRQWREVNDIEVEESDINDWIHLHRENVIRNEVRRTARRMLYDSSRKNVDELLNYVPYLSGSGPTAGSRLLDSQSMIDLYNRSLQSGRMGPPIKLGISRDYDSFWDGYRLLLIVGDTGHGKSTLLSWSAIATARLWRSSMLDSRILFFTLEGGIPRQITRFLSALSGINRIHLEGSNVDPETLEALEPYLEEFKELNIVASDERQLDSMIEHIESLALEPNGIGAVYIDYIQMIYYNGTASNEESALRAIANILVDVGDRYNIPIIAASQLSFADKNRPIPFGARAIAHKANLMLWLNKLNDSDGGPTAKVKCMKNTLGPLFEETLMIDYATNRVF